MSVAGERVELARYQLTTGERVLYGQRINGKVAVADVPVGDRGRVYLVERHVESRAALDELVAHYVADSLRRAEPAARCPAVEMLAEGLEFPFTSHDPPARASARRAVTGSPPGGLAN